MTVKEGWPVVENPRLPRIAWTSPREVVALALPAVRVLLGAVPALR